MAQDPGTSQAVVTVVDANVDDKITNLRDLVDAKTDGLRELVDAKVDGLQELVRAESSSTRELIAPLTSVPPDLAALEASGRALAERVDATATKDEYDALVQRVTDLEASHARALNWKALAAISLCSALLGGGLSHIPHF